MNTWEAAFNFDSLVWDWIIGIYLFLAGMSAGVVMVSIYLKRNVIEGDPANNGIIKTTAILAPLGIILGLLILVFHLTKPLMFWKIMIHYNLTSVMSIGVILFQVYMVVLFIWLGIIFREEIKAWLNGKLKIIDTLLVHCEKVENSIELFLGLLAVLLAAYTGFLLSALKTYPMLNNPVLPVLFLFSSLSSGLAACLLVGVVCFKEPNNSASVTWIHHIERPVVMFELFILVAFFTGLIFSGGQGEIAAWRAIGSGFWAIWFWVGVIGLGMLAPLILNHFFAKDIFHTKRGVLLVTGLTLLGVLMLRIFILYAGQMTLV